MFNKENNMLTITNDLGEKVECEILFTYKNEKTGVHYIAYTDNTEDDEGHTRVYASTFDPAEENPQLLPIETDEEWAMIENILDSITEDTEGDD